MRLINPSVHHSPSSSSSISFHPWTMDDKVSQPGPSPYTSILYWLYCTTVLQSKSHFCHVPSYDMCDDWYVIYLVTFLQPLNATSYPTQTRRQLPSHGCSVLLPEMLRLQVRWMGCTHEPFSCYSRPLWLTWHETSKSTPTNLSFQYEDPILDIRAPCQRKRLQQNTLHDHYDPTLDC